jgi:DNA primase catalytic subunit
VGFENINRIIIMPKNIFDKKSKKRIPVEDDTLSKIASNDVVERISNRIVAKKRPTDLFKGVFFDINEKIKEHRSKESEKARTYIENTIKKDMNSKKIKIVSLEIKLGSFKGNPYITTAPLSVVMSEDKANNFLGYLNEKYSPKYKIKSIKDGIITYNIRYY